MTLASQEVRVQDQAQALVAGEDQSEDSKYAVKGVMFKVVLQKPNLNPMESTYLVADLECKRVVQNEFLDSLQLLPEDACLRANEFWQKLLLQISPDKKIISNAFATTVLREFLKDRKEAWLQGSGIPNLVLKYLEFFLPILAHPNGAELVEDWLKQNQGAKLRWGHWLQISKEVYNWFITKKWLLAKWAPAVLLNHAEKLNWHSPIIADLNADLTGVELEIFRELGKNQDVYIVAPEQAWITANVRVLWPYLIAQDKPILTEASNSQVRLTSKFEMNAFATRLTEVKSVVSYLRSWLDKGTQPSQISVFVSEIENYWPVLSSYLKEEGIPYQKALVVVATSIPSVGQWLARLKIETGTLESEDLEGAIFSADVMVELNYSKFRELFSNIMDQEELSRFEALQKSFDFKIDANRMLQREEFLTYVLSRMPGTLSEDIVKSLISKLLLETSENDLITLRSWVSYFTNLAALVELQIESGSAGGIQILKLESSHIHNRKYVIAMGLTDRALSEQVHIQVSTYDILKMGQDLGFYLHRQDGSKSEYYLKWLLNKPYNEIYLTHAKTNFAGEAESPSLTWLEVSLNQKIESDDISPARESLWDKVQALNYSEIAKWREMNPTKSDQFVSSLKNDLGEVSIGEFAVDHKPKLSASSLKKYAECPFRFAATKLFSLTDINEIDIEVDSLRRGKLIHRVFEYILSNTDFQKLTDDRIYQLIDKAKAEEKLWLSGEFWGRTRREAFTIARRFIEFESQWRKAHPNLKTVGTEVSFKGEWHDFVVTGIIDRVDQDQEGHYTVLDYKNSKQSQHTHYQSWLAKSEFQLLFYMKAIESGWTKLAPTIVYGAFYYFIKNWQRDTGFIHPQATESMFPIVNNKKNKASDAGLEALRSEFERLFVEITKNILLGKYQPLPDNFDTCKKCEWRTLCRAPHLN